MNNDGDRDLDPHPTVHDGWININNNGAGWIGDLKEERTVHMLCALEGCGFARTTHA
jgi:hypothetical protein